MLTHATHIPLEGDDGSSLWMLPSLSRSPSSDQSSVSNAGSSHRSGWSGSEDDSARREDDPQPSGRVTRKSSASGGSWLGCDDFIWIEDEGDSVNVNRSSQIGYDDGSVRTKLPWLEPLMLPKDVVRIPPPRSNNDFDHGSSHPPHHVRGGSSANLHHRPHLDSAQRSAQFSYPTAADVVSSSNPSNSVYMHPTTSAAHPADWPSTYHNSLPSTSLSPGSSQHGSHLTSGHDAPPYPSNHRSLSRIDTSGHDSYHRAKLSIDRSSNSVSSHYPHPSPTTATEPHTRSPSSSSSSRHIYPFPGLRQSLDQVANSALPRLTSPSSYAPLFYPPLTAAGYLPQAQAPTPTSPSNTSHSYNMSYGTAPTSYLGSNGPSLPPVFPLLHQQQPQDSTRPVIPFPIPTNTRFVPSIFDRSIHDATVPPLGSAFPPRPLVNTESAVTVLVPPSSSASSTCSSLHPISPVTSSAHDVLSTTVSSDRNPPPPSPSRTSPHSTTTSSSRVVPAKTVASSGSHSIDQELKLPSNPLPIQNEAPSRSNMGSTKHQDTNTNTPSATTTLRPAKGTDATTATTTSSSGSNDPSQAAAKKARTPIACSRCRRHKLRCLGEPGQPCPACVKRGVAEECNYVSEVRRRGKGKAKRSVQTDPSTADHEPSTQPREQGVDDFEGVSDRGPETGTKRVAVTDGGGEMGAMGGPKKRKYTTEKPLTTVGAGLRGDGSISDAKLGKDELGEGTEKTSTLSLGKNEVNEED